MSFPIAYIAGTFPARSETFVYREVRALRESGWDVCTISLNDPREPGVPEFSDLEQGTIYVYGRGKRATLQSAFLELLTHPLRAGATLVNACTDAIDPREPMSLGNRLKLVAQAFASLGLARRLRPRGLQHIHCHFAHAPTTIGMYAARHLQLPFSFTGHANDLFQRRSLLKRKLNRARFVACISEWHRDFYKQVLPARLHRYHVIRCGVDVDAWTAKSDVTISEPLKILTVCRLVEKKGVDTLIRALPGKAWHVTIAGDGPDRPQLEKLARESGCQASITWLGSVENERVRELLQQSDVFVLPCREDRNGDRDGIPVVLIEAMACGIPVVSGDLPAIRELVIHQETGVLIDGNQPEHLTAGLAALINDPAFRYRLTRAARKHVETEFSMGVNLQRLTAQLAKAAAAQNV